MYPLLEGTDPLKLHMLAKFVCSMYLMIDESSSVGGKMSTQ